MPLWDRIKAVNSIDSSLHRALATYYRVAEGGQVSKEDLDFSVRFFKSKYRGEQERLEEVLKNCEGNKVLELDCLVGLVHPETIGTDKVTRRILTRMFEDRSEGGK